VQSAENIFIDSDLNAINVCSGATVDLILSGLNIIPVTMLSITLHENGSRERALFCG
jgi:hypothetical protein